MRKTTSVLSAIVVSTMIFAYQAEAQVIDQTTATAEAGVTAEVIQPIAIAKNADLSFGRFSVAAEGTVVIPADGSARTQSGGVLLPVGLAAGSRAQFTVTGDEAATYSVTMPADGVIVLSDGDSNTMDLSDFESTSTGNLVDGTEIIYVGATLNVADNQAAGSYSGTFDVIVDYN
ncbi:MAG TPA: DUF4402 domain-containing protein [Thermoanaerobaculia bacterium]